MKNVICTIIFLFTINNCAHAQIPQLVKDINTMNGSTTNQPIVLAHVADTVFFFANDGIHGMELWRSDGTELGTFMVKDINPGAANGVAFTNYFDAPGLHNVNGTLYFSGRAPGQNGLWKSDGTEAGTVFISIVDEVFFLGGGWSTHMGDTLYFSAGKDEDKENDEPPQPELWKSDGTVEGTVRVKDGVIIKARMTVMNNNIYFSGKTGNDNAYLWTSDGTTDGTTKITMMHNGEEAIYPIELMVWKDSLYFFADHPLIGSEPWISNGTEAGTHVVRDIWIGPNSSYVSGFHPSDSLLFFIAWDGIHGREMWKTNGTEAGTDLVKDLNPGSDGSGLTNFYNFQNIIYFSKGGNELWVSDGTSDGTVNFFDTNPIGVTVTWAFTELGDSLFFWGLSNVYGTTLLKTDGTRDSAWQVSGDLSFASTVSIPYSTANKLFFNFTNASFVDIGVELWTTDGTAANTELLKDINKVTQSGNPYFQYAWGNDLYFSANDGVHGSELWRRNGSSGTFDMVKNIAFSGNDLKPSSEPQGFFPIGNTLYFSAITPLYGRELWKTDGTPHGTIMLKNISTGAFSANPGNFTNVNGTLFFTARSTQLWKSDGTPEGTILVKAFNPSATATYPSNLTNYNGVLYFTAKDGDLTELWKSDGTSEGTVVAVKLYNNGSSQASGLTQFNGHLYFYGTKTAGSSGLQLWKSNGTLPGTIALPQQNGNPIKGYANGFIVDSLLFFTTFTQTPFNHSLWRSNGTSAGTFKVKDGLQLGSGISFRPYTAVLGSKFVFSATNDVLGYEPWISDGTIEGTHVIKDILEGVNASSLPQAFLAANGKVYFSAMNVPLVLNGNRELWETDGTEEGTKMVAEINPGNSNSTFISYPTLLGNTMYFAANDPAKGVELWKLDFGATDLPYTWTGHVNRNWENPANWNNYIVPGAYTQVIIPSGVFRYPTVNVSTLVLSLTCQNGAAVSVAPGVILTVQTQ